MHDEQLVFGQLCFNRDKPTGWGFPLFLLCHCSTIIPLINSLRRNIQTKTMVFSPPKIELSSRFPMVFTSKDRIFQQISPTKTRSTKNSLPLLRDAPISQDGRRLSEPGAGSEAQFVAVKIKDPGTRDFNLWIGWGKSTQNHGLYPLVMTNIAIENGYRNSGFSWIFPLKMVDLSIVMLVYQRVTILVGGSEHEFYEFPYIGNVIIPTDYFFQRGRYTTNQHY